MPRLPNDRWEVFAQGIANGETAKDAYVSAGYKPTGASESASRLVRKPDIVKRIQELRRAGLGEANVEITRERVFSRLHHLSKLSEANKQYSTAVKCEELIGKSLGMFIDSTNVRLEDLRNVPTDKLIEWLENAEAAKLKQLTPTPAVIDVDVIETSREPSNDNPPSTGDDTAADSSDDSSDSGNVNAATKLGPRLVTN